MRMKLAVSIAAAATAAALVACDDSSSASSEPVNNVPENPSPGLSSNSSTNVPLLPVYNLSDDLCGDLWCEGDPEGKVATGSEEETAGYWFVLSDRGEPYNGNSNIEFYYDTEDRDEDREDDDSKYSSFFCGGNFFCSSDRGLTIEGTATIGDAYSNPFVGIGFNLASENREPWDISSWEGVCLVYSSTGKLALELVQPGSPLIFESNNFGYELPKTKALSVINVPWSAFGLYDVSKSSSADPLWTVQNAAAIELRFYENSNFHVYSIGRYGTCGKEASVPASSASTSVSSSASSSASEQMIVNDTFLWKAPDAEGKVITGSPEETSGYWYEYTDSYRDGNSEIIYPSDVTENEYGNFFGPLNVKYEGIKAELKMGDAYEFAYAGFMFNIWSENQEGVDVTKWGGICLTYSSTESFYLKLDVEDEYYQIDEYGIYRAQVPASDSVATVSIPWSGFKYNGGWGCLGCSMERIAQKAANVRLNFEKSSSFLLKEIGSLNACGK